MSREIASDAAARVMLAPSAAAVSSLVPLAAIMTNRYIIAFLDFCMYGEGYAIVSDHVSVCYQYNSNNS